MNDGSWKAKIVTEANFVPIPKAKKGIRKATEEPEQLIRVSDAITTTWMILRGLGYTPEENKELAKTVKEVFATTPPALPPHGRLIDADYVMNNMHSEHPYVQNAIRATISAAPTIIPADLGIVGPPGEAGDSGDWTS